MRRILPRPDARHRIELCGLTTDRQIQRLTTLGVIRVPQARFLSELGDAHLEAVGERRSRLLHRQRSFRASAAHRLG